MKNTKSLLTGILTLMIAVLTSGCGNINDKQDQSIAETTTTTTVTTSITTTVTEATTTSKNSDNEKIMLIYSYQPGGEMTLEEFEARYVHYEFYYTGVIKDKKGNESQLSDEDFNKVKEYAEKVITGDKNVKEDNGDDMPSFSVSAFDEDGNAYDLKTLNSGWIEGTDNLDAIAEKYFPEDNK